MSHTIPLEPDCYYHIFNRGNNHEKLFVEERNYFHFMSLYGKYVQPVASTYAYCLLVDHFHFLIRIRTLEERMEYVRTQRHSNKYREGMFLEEAGSLDPSNQFSKLFNAYAKAFNATYKRTGSLFEGRFKRVPVTTHSQIIYLITYIHRNPEKHGFVGDFREWHYSSYRALLSSMPTQVDREGVFELFQGRDQFIDAHERGAEKQFSELTEKTP